tara:strand:+ start:3404 stop:4576 length:1173 start_codon:yes stop_codon:yes gene_type:complete
MIIIVDGSYFMHRLLHKNEVKSANDIKTFVDVMLSSTRKMIKQFQPSGIVFVKDSKPSWRHVFDYHKNLPSNIKGIVNERGYKGTRKYKSEYHWESVKLSYNKFLNIVQDKFSVDVIGIHQAEGDDIMAYISTVLSSMNLFTMLYTADADANQGLNFNTVRYSPQTQKLYVSDTLKNDVEFIKGDFFDNNGTSTSYYLSYLMNKMWYGENIIKSVEIVSAWEYMLSKIIRGDSGDNVHPIFFRVTKTETGKIINRKVPPKKISLFVEQLKESRSNINNDILYDDTVIEMVSNLICEIEGEKTHFNEYVKGFKNNRKMVLINNKELPQNLFMSLTEIDLRYPQERFRYSKDKLECYWDYIDEEFTPIEDTCDIEIKEDDDAFDLLDDFMNS